MDNETEVDLAEFDERHRDWLVRDSLELYALFCLAHGMPPRWPMDRPDLQPRWGALKSAVKAFPEIYSHRPDGLDRLAIVDYETLLACLENKDSHLDWLRQFAPRWQAYRPGVDVRSAEHSTGRPSSLIAKSESRSRGIAPADASDACLKNRAGQPPRKNKNWDKQAIANKLRDLVVDHGKPDSNVDPEWTRSRIVELLEDFCIDKWGESPTRSSHYALINRIFPEWQATDASSDTLDTLDTLDS